ncbi:hypothetical protein IWQ62_003550 [Dispira parvispora]|uniref:CDK5RAP1-like protein n=1 Tax=Dispira parvispora TaxID=1520584 RepID=A0A9W8AQP4_9FUNG|nr:hypothetical protein IWQ62_003550 [Dispira parvispora]
MDSVKRAHQVVAPLLRLSRTPVHTITRRRATATTLLLAQGTPQHFYATTTTTTTTRPELEPVDAATPAKSTTDSSFSRTTTHRMPQPKSTADGRRKLVFDNRGPSFQDFIQSANALRLGQLQPAKEGTPNEDVGVVAPYLRVATQNLAELGQGRKFFVEVYGCQMNVNDTEVLMAILQEAGYQRTMNVDEAHVVFLMTCSIRDNAEKKIWARLRYYKSLANQRNGNQAPLVGVLGCMAERLKDKLLDKDKLVDVVCGPDAYRSLPHLLSMAEESMLGVANVLLSTDETYADITPVRLHPNQVSVHLSIMRGCNNMCSYCIVPFTRGTERSRSIRSIVQEVEQLNDQGIKEIMLLGQNVNSYRDVTDYHSYPAPSPEASSSVTADAAIQKMSRGFKTIYKTRSGGLTFTNLMDEVSRANPEIRFRFTSPHPKDFPDDLLNLIRDRPNICSNIHLPVQSGNSAVLERMRRGYTREAYLELVDLIRQTIPDVTISSDFIVGFCGETESEHRDTVTLMEQVKYDTAYMFAYSMREKTHAHRRWKDDVPADIKSRRLTEIIDVFHTHARAKNQALVGRAQLVLVDGFSKKYQCWQGRTDGNHKVFIQSVGNPDRSTPSVPEFDVKVGDYVEYIPTTASSTALRGYAVAPSSIKNFYSA